MPETIPEVDIPPAQTEASTKARARPKGTVYLEFEDEERCFDCSAGDHVCKVSASVCQAWDRQIAAGTVFDTIPSGIACQRCTSRNIVCYFPVVKDGDNLKPSNWEQALFQSAYRLAKGVQKLTEEQEMAADGEERIAEALERLMVGFESATPVATEEVEETDDMEE